MEKLKLSGLKRIYFVRLELGPYLNSQRKRYATWWAELPGNRVVFVAHQVRGPILAQKIVEGLGWIEPMDLHKWAKRFTGNALYHHIKAELELVTRPMVKMCGDSKPNKNSYWSPFEAGHSTDTLGKWREEVLYVLEHKYGVRDYSRELPEIEASHQPEIEASLRAQAE